MQCEFMWIWLNLETAIRKVILNHNKEKAVFYVFQFRHQGTLDSYDFAKNRGEKNKLAQLGQSFFSPLTQNHRSQEFLKMAAKSHVFRPLFPYLRSAKLHLRIIFNQNRTGHKSADFFCICRSLRTSWFGKYCVISPNSHV